MAGFTTKSTDTAQWQEYVSELRELFQQRGLAHGRPEDLPLFVQTLGRDAGLADEMRSMVRSILFREEEQIGRMELLELLALAVGGPPASEPAPVTQESVRELFTFVNQALRMPAFGDWEGPAAPAVPHPDRPLTASDILATTAPVLPTAAAPVALVPPATAAHIPATPVSSAAGETAPGPRERYVAQEATQREAAAESLPDAPPRIRPQPLAEEPDTAPVGSGRSRWQVPVFVAGLLLTTGLGFVVGRNASFPAQPSLQGLTTHAAAVDKPMRLGVCVQDARRGVSHSSLNAQMQEAHQLMDGTVYAQALPLLQDVARLDPGYPGVGLDISQTLLRLHRLEPAREAVDQDINQAECLTRLPKEELDRYCSAQYEAGAQSSCRPQLAHQRQAAQMQAALVHIEMGHAISDSGDAAALSELTQAAESDQKAGTSAPAQQGTHP